MGSIQGWERDLIMRECQLVKASSTPIGRANFEITCAPHHGNRLGNSKWFFIVDARKKFIVSREDSFAQQSKILKCFGCWIWLKVLILQRTARASWEPKKCKTLKQKCWQHNSLRRFVREIEPDFYCCRWPIRTASYSQSHLLVHGGCTATLFDSTTTAALIAISRPGFWVSSGVSRTLNVTYLRPVTQGTTVIIETEVVHAGKRLGKAPFITLKVINH